ncbi:MAG TPA: CBS domain-containing protein [Spirochaetota bacterium]
MPITDLTRPQFLYLSELIGKSIHSASSRTRYILHDFVATPTDVYPRCVGIVVRRRFSRLKAFVPWKDISRKGRSLVIQKEPEIYSKEISLEGSTFLLGETLFDQQIVDISGSKVVRVNDLHLLAESNAMWLVHVDIGFTGILRRLGWLRLINIILKWLFHVAYKDRFISWKYVQPLPSSTGVGVTSLKINQRLLSEMHPADLAEILTDLAIDERSEILEALDEETAARTLQEIPLKLRAPLVESMSPEKAARIIENMHRDEAVDLFPELDIKVARSILALLPSEQSVDIRELLIHSRNSAGGIMNTECLTGSPTMSVSQILAHIKDDPHEWETVAYVYVIDAEEALVGVVSLREIVSADPAAILEDIMKKKIITVEPETPVNRVSILLFKYNFAAIPVVDEGKLAGIVTMRDAFGAAFPEIREDMEEMS